MNPRYLAYCRAHGRTPAEMLEHDDKEWPGGKMTGFILWLDDSGWNSKSVTSHHYAEYPKQTEGCGVSATLMRSTCGCRTRTRR
jgi:hypothetical protein